MWLAHGAGGEGNESPAQVKEEQRALAKCNNVWFTDDGLIEPAYSSFL